MFTCLMVKWSGSKSTMLVLNWDLADYSWLCLELPFCSTIFNRHLSVLYVWWDILLSVRLGSWWSKGKYNCIDNILWSCTCVTVWKWVSVITYLYPIFIFLDFTVLLSATFHTRKISAINILAISARTKLLCCLITSETKFGCSIPRPIMWLNGSAPF